MLGSFIRMEDLLTHASGRDEASRAAFLRHSNGPHQYFFPISLGFSDNNRILPGNADPLHGALKLLRDELTNRNHVGKEEVLSSVT